MTVSTRKMTNLCVFTDKCGSLFVGNDKPEHKGGVKCIINLESLCTQKRLKSSPLLKSIDSYLLPICLDHQIRFLYRLPRINLKCFWTPSVFWKSCRDCCTSLFFVYVFKGNPENISSHAIRFTSKTFSGFYFLRQSTY